jgi:acyl carrier protein
MNVHDRVEAAIYRAIDEINIQMAPSDRLSKARHTVLFGRERGLDSLGLVNLIVAVESQIEQDFGKSVKLSEAMFSVENPFTDVASLGAYVTLLLQKG